MSVLYGFLNRNSDPALPDTIALMRRALSGYRFDHQGAMLQGGCALGFGKQICTVESIGESLPYHDSDGYLIVSDAVLDNREELAHELPRCRVPGTSDSVFILEAYKRWGTDCVRHLLGDFAFAVYHFESRTVFMARDPMGTRTLYYAIQGDRVAFSTVVEPLKNLLCLNGIEAIDKRWLTDFLAIPSVFHEIEPDRTVWTGVSQVPPASWMLASPERIKSETYWDPMNSTSKHRADEAQEVFADLFQKAVSCRLRTDGAVGATLSGGLDSSSVACTAAQMLSRRGDALHTFTAIPFEGYREWLPGHLVADESESVRTIGAWYPNMNLHFERSEGVDSYGLMPEMVRIMEQPYKFIDNSYWLYSICRAASNQGCRILLGGQFGNATLSYGHNPQYLAQLFRSFRWPAMLQHIHRYCRRNRLSRKDYFQNIFPLLMRDSVYRERGGYANEICNQEALRRYDVEGRLQRAGYTRKLFPEIDRIRSTYLSPGCLNQLAACETKMGLRFGIRMRDPSRDRRVVEFCMQTDESVFFRNGADRGLVRNGMRGIVPAEILGNIRTHGRQSADWLQRLEPCWNHIAADAVCNLKQLNMLEDVIDRNQVEALLERTCKAGALPDDSADHRTVLVLLSVMEYIRNL